MRLNDITTTSMNGCATYMTPLTGSRSSSSHSSSVSRNCSRRRLRCRSRAKTQIVARLMVEDLAFYGIRNAQDVATCLNGYDQTAYPERSHWSFTRFYVPQSFDTGYRLLNDGGKLWQAIAAAPPKSPPPPPPTKPTSIHYPPLLTSP